MPRMTFIARDGTAQQVDGTEGATLLQISRANDVDIEGACEGNMACATCHVVVQDPWYDRLIPPSDDEEDMLDLAYGLTETSRLGCQIQLTSDLDGLVVRLPDTGESF
jgi:ferredoxin, 2Fe-2S